jgi:cell division protein FtsB
MILSRHLANKGILIIFLITKAIYDLLRYLYPAMIILKILKNKYFLTVVALVIWLLFFDKNDVFTQMELIRKCEKLKSEKQYYINEIASNNANLFDLKNNKRSLETFSREKYLMKKENEDVFIIVPK